MAYEIQPHEFLGGTETEFATVPIFKDKHTPNESECGALASMAIANMPKDLHVSPIASFEKSGRRIYKDVGGLLEVASAEFRSYRDLVHATIAGEYLVVTGALNATKHRSDLSSVAIQGRVIDDKDTTWGHHENYLVRRNTFSEGISNDDKTGYNTLRRAMCAHLATRVIFTGAGILRPTFTNPARVVPGQKTRSLECDISNATTRNKPLFNIRDEAHANEANWARLHVVSGDYNISPFASWLRLGTTAIVAYLCEIGMINRRSEMFLNDQEAFEIARAVGTGVNSKFYTRNDRKVSAVDIQEELCEVSEACASTHPGLLTEEDLEIVASWRETIDTYRRNPSELQDKLDYMGRANFLRNYFEKRPESAGQLKDVEKYWDNLIMGKAVELRDECGMPGYDERAITQLLRQPPLNTRANIRGKLVDLVAHTPELSTTVNWRNIKLCHDKGSLSLPLPIESGGTPDDEALSRLTKFLGTELDQNYFAQHSDCRKEAA